VGLGNPGVQYRDSRHNAGFAVVDELSRRTGIRLKRPLFRAFRFGRGRFNGSPLVLAEPLTFMNRSGTVIAAILKRSRAELRDVVVVADNMDLLPGAIRLRPNGSSGGQKGIQSIIDALGTAEFARLSIGIGHPAAGTVVEHVLGVPDDAEREAMLAAVQAAADALLALVTQPIDRVMNDVNRRR
jgi:peptidyl-tRNA hydrolase, PTH1 family